MAYTPINWQTGDTITAEKMNKMDNGWGIQEEQLFNEAVTTRLRNGAIMGSIDYYELIDFPEIIVTFEGTDYTCPRVNGDDAHFYGGFSGTEPDFSTYPFFISCSEDINMLFTESAGTYTVAVTAPTVVVGDNFSTAVNKVVDTSALPLRCVDGVTAEEEMASAWQSRLLYFYYDAYAYIITGIIFPISGAPLISFIPENSSITASFDNGIFTITSE